MPSQRPKVPQRATLHRCPCSFPRRPPALRSRLLDGRAGDEASLRNALALTRPAGIPGPAGRVHLAWRALVPDGARNLPDIAAEGYQVNSVEAAIHVGVSATSKAAALVTMQADTAPETGRPKPFASDK